MLRKILRLFFLLTVLLPAAVGSAANLPSLRVGYINAPGYFTRNERDEYSGSLYEQMEVLAACAGFEPVYVRLAPEAAEPALNAGDIDALVGIIAPDAYDSPRFDLISRYVGKTPVYLSRPYGSEAPSEGRRLRVGYLAPLYPALLEYPRLAAVNENFRHLECIPYDDEERLYLDYRQGNLEGYLTSGCYFDDAIPVERVLLSANLYLAVRKGNRPLREALESGFERALGIQPNFRSEAGRPRAGAVAPLVLDRDEREYLRAHPVIHVASAGHQAPFTYFEDGEARGILQDILDIAGEDLGVRIETLDAGNNETLMKKLAEGLISVAPVFNLDYNRARKVNARLTSSYLALPYVPVQRRYQELPVSPRVACPRHHHFGRRYVEAHYTEEKIIWRDTYEECFEAVSRGEADLLFAKALSAQQMLQSGQYANLTSTGQTVATQRLAFAVSKDADPRLFTILSKEVEHLDPARIQALVGKYASEINAQRSWRTYLIENPLRSVAIVLGFALLVIGVLMYIMRLRSESERQLFDAAYRNPFTGLRTLSWFEKYVPGLIEKKHAADRREGRLFLMNLLTHRFDLMKATYDQNVLFTGIAGLTANVREKNPWILYDSISSELSQMYILGRREDGMTSMDAAEHIINDAAEIPGESGAIRMNYRIGLCDLPPEGELDLPHLMANAAIARNEATLHGETTGIYDEALQNRRILERKIEDLMYKALEYEEFEIWLQPKYELTNRRVIGAEALVRWQSPELGFLMPYQFITLFEKNGFIIPFDYYMLEHVFRLQKQLLADGHQLSPIAVNQSGLHMREAGYLGRMQEMLKLYDLPPHAVELELTETAFIDFDTKEAEGGAADIVANLREMGYAVAMDDFCTGYSSIAMLQRIPMDVMKIDRAMLLASENSPRGQKILRNVAGFGKSLDMLVLCEGIETEEQEALLLANGCQYGQGFLFARPMPAGKYAAFLMEHEIEPQHENKSESAADSFKSA